MPKKPSSTDRQAVLDELRKKQKRARGRGYVIVGACVGVALLIVAVAAYRPIMDWRDRKEFEKTALGSIGTAASVCGDITTTPTDGTQEHKDPRDQIIYPTAPPAYGAHWSVQGLAPAPFARKFYTDKDRPELEALVHNLEHGYTILWYDQTVADDADQLAVVKGIAQKFESSDNPRFKFIAAPWTTGDVDESGAFPDGMHVAISHWSAGGEGETDKSKQQGVFQYCSEPSGAALKEFMGQYPYTDSPEPLAM